MTSSYPRRSKQLSKLTAAVVITLALVGCLSMKKSETSAPANRIVEHVSEELPVEAPSEFRAGLELLQARKYTDALTVLDRYIGQNSVAPYTQSAILNTGRALEGLERYSEAAQRYRAVIVATNGIAPRLEAMALYRSSFCHEALSSDQQTVAVLVDLFERLGRDPGVLPEEVARAELPARLAAAYARIGNYQLALDYYKKAEVGIGRLRRSGKGSVPNWLPRTLYYMGRLAAHPVNWDDFESALRPLAHGQIYLLEASDLAVEPWADQAASDLIMIYRQLLTVVESAPVGSSSDPLLDMRKIQEKQWDRATLITENLQELVARQAPGPREKLTPSSLKIFDFVDELYIKLHGILAARPAGEGLTPEALARSHSVRGRVVSPDGFLERKFLESSRQPTPSGEKPPSKKDPNL